MRAAVADALRARLALQHEAVWLLGLVGGRFERLRERARAASVRHRRERDRLLAVLAAAGEPAPGPRLGHGAPPRTAEAARGRVADVQERLAAAALAHLAVVEREDREEPMAALRTAALTAIDWDAAPRAFPGLD